LKTLEEKLLFIAGLFAVAGCISAIILIVELYK